MSKPPLPSGAIEMLTRPNPCVIATLRSDGSPVATPTWYLWEDGRVLVNMDEGRRRLAHVRRDPRVTLSVMDEESWYTHVSLIGRVVDIREDTDLADIDRLSHHYTGKPYPVRDRGRVSAWIEIDRWHGWGGMKDNDQTG
ncbi:PPOX class F420-dependent oxidoreductase [Streptomyces calidiresistens]|uniref:TIGR03618 family F420-dependent PPOX class oxidoreductase n=1 Tax=Streptomyces calidiresistens TaxID=1485586 RepID=A0A7W3T644_9ACTN|nr:TIGR03618 family F420-dependent PPOX class oxidoreductase [Streptomyces calidiresistens]MBB0231634.1 TIGR03618 family F420-dependent PPOX class oxidoreductase [Streptomyces calidiresistens]